MVNIELRCNKMLTLTRKDLVTGSPILGDIIRERWNGLLALRERIVEHGEAFFLYECTRCGARTLIKGWAEEGAEDTHKVPSVQDSEDRILEEHR